MDYFQLAQSIVRAGQPHCDYCEVTRGLANFRVGGGDSPVFKTLCPSHVTRILQAFVLERV